MIVVVNIVKIYLRQAFRTYHIDNKEHSSSLLITLCTVNIRCTVVLKGENNYDYVG